MNVIYKSKRVDYGNSNMTRTRHSAEQEVVLLHSSNVGEKTWLRFGNTVIIIQYSEVVSAYLP